MQIPLKWINELVNIDSIDLDDLIEKLTLGGFEVEETIELEIDNQKQIALDISATANRSDSLSIQGISTEIAALLNKATTISSYSLKNFDWKKNLDNSIITMPDKSNCSTFLAVIIKNVKNFTVPKWIKQKLISSGITPVNNLLDFQNYILLETGYPFAFYDFDKICSKLNCSNFNYQFQKLKIIKNFIATNDTSYKIKFFNFIIKANEIPIKYCWNN
jgi:phenylalanyl-tRNA synthetase beta chain